jgi:stage II sporulation protein D
MCYPDMETLVLINIVGIEDYIAGVVESEGGAGRNIEYYKTQAVIARTYLYKYFDKHISDRYNLCDDTHCQAFKGYSSNPIIFRAALETRDLVILDKDSSLIVAAFHSNCGGETSPPEDVWLTCQSYLKRVTDPYCLTSRNARWVKIIKREDWIAYLKRSGNTDDKDIPASFSFIQNSRLTDYKTEAVSIPLRNIRTDLDLRSTFFSVTENNSSIILNGRGYGHGVGLCQEGAMAMASQGFRFNQIIDFYYSGVLITDIKNAVILPPEPSFGR